MKIKKIIKIRKNKIVKQYNKILLMKYKAIIKIRA